VPVKTTNLRLGGDLSTTGRVKGLPKLLLIKELTGPTLERPSPFDERGGMHECFKNNSLRDI